MAITPVSVVLFLAIIVVPGICVAGRPPGSPWTLIQNIPGGNACAARLPGHEVDISFMLNEFGQLILAAGKPDWHMSGSFEVKLRIDSVEVDHLQANAFNNLTFLLVKDESTVTRLRVARDLYWTLPSGMFHATVSGFGNALDWVQACEQAKRAGLAGGA